MTIVTKVLIGVVALLHVYFLVLEMFLWTKPFGLKTFARTQAEQDATAVMAKNPGLYNGFLAVGLAWSLVEPNLGIGLARFFLGCIVVAGLYGAATASRKILFVQALPAALALASTWLF